MSRLAGVHTTLLAVVAALLLVQLVEQVAAIPASAASANPMDVALLQRAMRQGNECAMNAGIRDLCQRCAKVTRSAVAYPLCCQNQENPRRWCLKFLEFGLT